MDKFGVLHVEMESPVSSSLPRAVEEENMDQDDEHLQAMKRKSCTMPHPGAALDELTAWRRCNPDDWGPNEVLAWLAYEGKNTSHINITKFRLERFNKCSGKNLCAMTKEDYIELEPNYGSYIYTAFQAVLRNTHYNGRQSEYEKPNMDCRNLTEEHKVMRESIAQDQKPPSHFYQGSVQSPYASFYPTTINQDALSSEDTYPKFAKRGRPPKKHLGCAGVMDGRVHKKPGQTTRERLWKFVCDLLRDPQYNPSHVCWEKKEEGIFRFVQSEKVAKMWGDKKNNGKMTYEKLSRAMRYCRTSDFFAEVPKDRNFPKKLCFRFGPKAIDWKNI